MLILVFWFYKAATILSNLSLILSFIWAIILKLSLFEVYLLILGTGWLAGGSICVEWIICRVAEVVLPRILLATARLVTV